MLPFKTLCLSALVLSLSSVTYAQTELPGPLIDAEWLAEHESDVIILDVRKDIESYLTDGHIDGSRLVNVKKIRFKQTHNELKLTGMMPTLQQYQQLISSMGLSENDTVIISHKGETAGHVAGAARLYWQMKFFGFKNVAMLDGGNRAWEEALGDLTQDNVDITPTQFSGGTLHTESLATVKDVEFALTNDNSVLIDTRNLRFHIGLEKRSYVSKYGHIPGSRLLPYKFLFPSKGPALFFDKDTLDSIINSLRIDKNKNLILYCNSAYECSAVWFALHKIMGIKNVTIYDGSLNEWTQDDEHPMTRQITQ